MDLLAGYQRAERLMVKASNKRNLSRTYEPSSCEYRLLSYFWVPVWS